MLPLEVSRSATLPVDMDDIAKALRVDFDDDDDAIRMIVLGEIRRYEDFTRRCILQSQWKIVSASWRQYWLLKIDPVRSVVVKYLDTDGVEQTLPETAWALVEYDACMGGPIVAIRHGAVLPDLADEADAVRILIDAGADLPGDEISIAPLDSADRAAILHMTKRVYDQDDPLSDENMRQRFAGRRLLW